MWSLDESGALLAWYSDEDEEKGRTGMGWMQPAGRWQLPKTTLTYAASGAPEPRFTVRDDEEAAEALRGTLPWLPVRHGGVGRAKEVVNRPAGPIDRPPPPGGAVMVITTEDAGIDGAVTAARRQPTAVVHGSNVYCTALPTSTGHEIVVIARVDPQGATGPDGYPTAGFTSFVAHTVSLQGEVRVTMPRVDIPDPSRGARPPSVALLPRVRALGSDYLLAPLAMDVVGVFSLASGSLVGEIGLPWASVPSAGPYAIFAIVPAPSDQHGPLLLLGGGGRASLDVVQLDDSDARVSAMQRPREGDILWVRGGAAMGLYEGKWLPCHVMEEEDDGTWSVLFERDDSEEYVLRAMDLRPRHYLPGMRIRALYDDAWYGAEVRVARAGNRYEIVFDGYTEVETVGHEAVNGLEDLEELEEESDEGSFADPNSSFTAPSVNRSTPSLNRSRRRHRRR